MLVAVGKSRETKHFIFAKKTKSGQAMLEYDKVHAVRWFYDRIRFNDASETTEETSWFKENFSRKQIRE